MMVLAPFIMLLLFSSIAFVLQFASWVLSMTRYPIWAKRKLWRFLKPPVIIDQQLEDEDLTAKVARKLKNLKRKITYGFLTRFTKPIPASTLQARNATAAPAPLHPSTMSHRRPSPGRQPCQMRQVPVTACCTCSYRSPSHTHSMCRIRYPQRRR